MKLAYFPVNQQKLKTSLFFPPKLQKENPGVLFIHGWTSSEKGYLPRAKAVASQGAICLTFDMRGHGKSGGDLKKFSRADHLKDALTAYDFLVSQKGVDKKKVGVVGASYGGYLASILSSKRKVKWLVLRAPALYKNKGFNKPTFKVRLDHLNLFEYLQSKINAKDNLALKSLSTFKGKVLMIKSENDETIPEQTIQNYLNAINPKTSSSLKTIKEANHALTKEKWKKEFIKILKDWFKDKFI